jgi:hypothetical protein
MSVSLQRAGVLALAGLVGLAILATPVRAQVRRPTSIQPITVNAQSFFAANRVNPNPFIGPGMTLNQYTYNVARLGQAYSNIPPWLLGYNPYTPSVVTAGGGYPAITPYAVSTVGGGYNPYTGGYGASLATDPYSLSTTGGYSPYGSPYYGDYSSGGYLRGAADLTAATGKYWKDIQQARLLREQSRQMALETERKRLIEEAWYERMRPKAQDVRDQELAADLTRARRDPPLPEVWSGAPLNALLRSLAGAGKLSKAPSSPLDEEILKGINLTNGASRGNLGMLKDPNGLNWPLTLKDSTFDEPRKRLNTRIRGAIDQVRKDKEPLDDATRRDLDADFRTISDRLTASVNDLTPSQYIEARRFLNQLEEALIALKDPRVVQNFSSWSPRGTNVAELVDHMNRNGLKFAPAAPGDENAYTALYYALRNFEASMQSAK